MPERPNLEYSSRAVNQREAAAQDSQRGFDELDAFGVELVGVEIAKQLDVVLHAGQRRLQVMGDHGDEAFQFLLFLV